MPQGEVQPKPIKTQILLLKRILKLLAKDHPELEETLKDFIKEHFRLNSPFWVGEMTMKKNDTPNHDLNKNKKVLFTSEFEPKDGTCYNVSYVGKQKGKSGHTYVVVKIDDSTEVPCS